MDDFTNYLNRHIGPDEDEHGPRANRLLRSLCGTEESCRQVAEETAVNCFDVRRGLWDGIYDVILREKNTTVCR